MKYLLIALLLSGCSTVVPVKQKFPPAPQVLQEPCFPLKTLGDPSTLSEFTKTVVDNYTLYHGCAAKAASWVQWYQEQKKIFEDIK